MSKHTVVVTSFKRCHRGTLVGFAVAYISEVNLTIGGIAVHRSASGAHWVQLAARPQIDGDGNLKRTSDGRIEYVKVFGFANRATGEAFSRAVIRALREFDPSVLETTA